MQLTSWSTSSPRVPKTENVPRVLDKCIRNTVKNRAGLPSPCQEVSGSRGIWLAGAEALTKERKKPLSPYGKIGCYKLTPPAPAVVDTAPSYTEDRMSPLMSHTMKLQQKSDSSHSTPLKLSTLYRRLKRTKQAHGSLHVNIMGREGFWGVCEGRQEGRLMTAAPRTA